MTTWEPYIAGFTGMLTTFVTKTGYRFTISKDCPRVTKGQPFMMEIETASNKLRMLRVHLPPDWIGRRKP